MGKLDELEHDTVEDGSAAVVPGMAVTIRDAAEAPEVEAKRDRVETVRARKEKRAAVNKAAGRAEDAAWCSIENDAIWDGEASFTD